MTVMGCDECGKVNTDINPKDYNSTFKSEYVKMVEQGPEEGRRTMEIDDDWQVVAHPDPEDPIAVTYKHYCPNCK